MKQIANSAATSFWLLPYASKRGRGLVLMCVRLDLATDPEARVRFPALPKKKE
jgi:hypothetical protein